MLYMVWKGIIYVDYDYIRNVWLEQYLCDYLRKSQFLQYILSLIISIVGYSLGLQSPTCNLFNLIQYNRKMFKI